MKSYADHCHEYYQKELDYYESLYNQHQLTSITKVEKKPSHHIKKSLLAMSSANKAISINMNEKKRGKSINSQAEINSLLQLQSTPYSQDEADQSAKESSTTTLANNELLEQLRILEQQKVDNEINKQNQINLQEQLRVLSSTLFISFIGSDSYCQTKTRGVE